MADPRLDTAPGILRKTFRGFVRAWYDKLPAGDTDGLPLRDQIKPIAKLADWSALDPGPLLQRGAIYGTSATDARGQIFNCLQSPNSQLWRLREFSIATADGGTSLSPRVAWWISNTSPGGVSENAPVQLEGEALKVANAAFVFFGDLNQSLPTYHFAAGSVAPVDRLFHPLGDGQFFYMRIDTGAGAGTAIDWAVSFEMLRTDDQRDLEGVSRQTYRGDG